MNALPVAGPFPRPRPEERGSAAPPREPIAAHDPARDVLRRLADGSRGFSRFDVEDCVGEGGMGIVLRVHDPDLNRTLALKRMKPPRVGAELPHESARRVARFLDEAQVTGQLDHPGIIPVHELGLDPFGQPYFTMKLVRGKTLKEILPLARENLDGWNATRALGVLLRMCEAMTYAHAHGVVHRDLKPANVMIGRFGEVYVMDWGLARVFGAEDQTEFHDLRHGSSPDGSPLITEDGEVFGTPAYMSPEQATGHPDAIGPQSDVYAIGAILYEMLAGSAPFTYQRSPTNNRQVLERLRNGPPTALEEVARHAPAELVAICRCAMERDPDRRYASMEELADDLRAYLELRVVRAYRTGPVVELRKWFARNRAVGILSLLGFGVLAVSGFVLATIESRHVTAVARDTWELHTIDLVPRAAALPLLRADVLPIWDRWLADARAAVSRRSEYERDLDQFVAANASAPRIPDPLAAARKPDEGPARNLSTMLAFFQTKIAQLETPPGSSAPHAQHDLDVLRIEVADLPRRLQVERERITRWRDWRFADDGLAARHDRLEAVCDVLRTLADPENGRVTWVTRTLSRARASVREHREDWQRALREVADLELSPKYRGSLTIVPQLGLVPLGQDPISGLQEFWHVPSGDRPVRGEDGSWVIRPETGIVLVLVPGGTTMIGAQQRDPTGANFVPDLDGDESRLHAYEHAPVHAALDPFLLSRYELTQGQWLRSTGGNPSSLLAGGSHALRRKDKPSLHLPRYSRTHPVETVTWRDCRAQLALWGLELPTEAQWEYAARAGRSTPYWSGPSFATLRDKVNWMDPISAEVSDGGTTTDEEFAAAHDRWPFHAPVDAFPPNPWGFHSISGNVAEWCRDAFGEPCDDKVRHAAGGDAENRPPLGRGRAVRGGSFKSTPGDLRVSRRYGLPAETADEDRGVRPAWTLDLNRGGEFP
jgi:formylglycine-generating enzyme required for sulfatase activity/tRNA A-37 threonylcarbamoyl transferase component Bud32